MINEKMIVRFQRPLTERVYEITLQGELAKKAAGPGQFVQVRCGGGTERVLRRPISIASYNKESGELTLIYRVEGSGTRWLSGLAQGAEVDVLGPLGHGFPFDTMNKGETALLVGGGVGVPPLYGLALNLREQGISVISVLGFASATEVFYEEKFAALGQCFIATDDGSAGFSGRVTDVIDHDQLSSETQAVFSCGPLPMLAALNNRDFGQPLYISLEQRMGCGIGACFACVCKTTDSEDEAGYRKVCTDGPVFKQGELIL